MAKELQLVLDEIAGELSRHRRQLAPAIELPRWIRRKGERWVIGALQRSLCDAGTVLEILAELSDDPIRRAIEQDLSGLKPGPSVDQLAGLDLETASTVVGACLHAIWTRSLASVYGPVLSLPEARNAAQAGSPAQYGVTAEGWAITAAGGPAVAYSAGLLVEARVAAGNALDGCFSRSTHWSRGTRMVELFTAHDRPLFFGVALVFDLARIHQVSPVALGLQNSVRALEMPESEVLALCARDRSRSSRSAAPAA